MASWKSQHGTFTFSRSGWSATLKIPAFDAFCYETGRKRPLPKGSYKIFLEAKDERDIPAEAMVQIVDRVFDDSLRLTDTIARALWDDFNGRGPKSRMWWHGDLAEVNKVLSHWAPGTKLKNVDDVLKVIYLQGVTLLKEQKAEKGRPIINPFNGEVLEKVNIPYRPAVATMHFYAAFEREHGLDILTDGNSVLGLGYATEAEMYSAM